MDLQRKNLPIRKNHKYNKNNKKNNKKNIRNNLKTQI